MPAPAEANLETIKLPPAVQVEPSYSSVHDTTDGGRTPPIASAAFCVPAPAKSYLAVDKAPPADHEVPLYSSVHDTAKYEPSNPPKASAEFCVPAPAEKRGRGVIKAPPADHDVPLYSSVHAPGEKFPPKASPAFCVPAPANCSLWSCPCPQRGSNRCKVLRMAD